MSDLLNQTTENPIKKPKGKLEKTDIDLREANDNYNRKNAILWVLSGCLMLVIIAISILFLINIFINQHIQTLLLDKIAENIVVVITVALALFGIQINTNK